MSVGLGSGTPWVALQAGASGRASALIVAKASHVLSREGTAGQGLPLELKCVKCKDALLHPHLDIPALELVKWDGRETTDTSRYLPGRAWLLRTCQCDCQLRPCCPGSSPVVLPLL